MPAIRLRPLCTLAAFAVLLLLVLVLIPSVAAQTTGTPLIRAYPRQEYGGAVGQVFDGTQDKRGVLYFTTADSGLLEYDGERWRSIETEGFMRAVAIDDRDRIWIAGASRLGYLDSTESSGLAFNDLTPLLPEEQRTFSATWPILPTAGGVFFGSREYLFRYRDSPQPHFDTWYGDADQIFYRLYELDGRLLVAQIGVGLLELTAEDQLVELGDGELAGATEINSLFSLGDGTLLAFTRLRGAFIIRGRHIEAVSGPASAWLQEQQVQHGCALPDGRFAIGTRRGGVGILDRDLNLHLVIDQQSDMSDQSVNVVFLDRRRNLWAATENGVNRIMLETATAGFGASAGLPEAGIAQTLPLDDELYVATLAGLYRGDRTESISGPDVIFDPNPLLETQVWHLLHLPDTLVAATTDGIFEFRSRARPGISLNAARQLTSAAALELLPLPPENGAQEPTKIIVGMAAGLGLLEKSDGFWQFTGRLPGLQLDVWELALGQDGEILAYMPTTSQAAIVDFAQGFEKEPTVYRHDSEGASSFIELQGRLHLVGAGNFWSYAGLAAARAGAAFERDSELTQLGELGVGTVLLEDRMERLWVSTERGLRIAERESTGEFALRSVTQSLLDTPFSAIDDPVLDETYWIGTVDGLFRVTPRTEATIHRAPTTLLRRVVAISTSRELDGGSGAVLPAPSLEYEENALRFEFASPTYDQGFKTLYRVRLDGFDEKWTAWSEESLKEYTSLSEGAYTFRAQAQDAHGTLGPVASWSFRILPPWYRTLGAFAGYFLGAIGLVLLLVRSRTSRLDHRRTALEHEVESRTVELAAEKDQVERQARDLERVNRLLAEENEHRRHLEDERAKLQERAEQSQKLESLGLMAGGIAHDFNNILMAILGNADLCLEEEGLRESLDRRLRAISDAGRRAAELCQQMLAYAGKGNFEEREIDLSGLASETLDILRVSIGDEIRIETHLARELPALLGDPSKISQLVLNLLSNASEAIGRDTGGHIVIETGTEHLDAEKQQDLVLADPIPEGPYVFVRVQDNGEGMDEETRRRIFDPFFTTKFAGRGLGLAATLGILRSHAGAISVQSELGKGTTVAAYFPALDHTADDAVPKTPESVRRWQPSGTILVVDDEAVVRDVVELILRNTGFDVLTASSGQQALEIYGAEGKRIHAIILDLTMPGMDGLATFERLQLFDPDVRVLLSSGYSGDTLIERYLEKGFAGFIAKPYRPASLRAQLREILNPKNPAGR